MCCLFVVATFHGHGDLLIIHIVVDFFIYATWLYYLKVSILSVFCLYFTLKYFLLGHWIITSILLIVVKHTISITYLDKCYCPGKDPYLSRDKNLRNKMYELKSIYSGDNLDIWWRPGELYNILNIEPFK